MFLIVIYCLISLSFCACHHLLSRVEPSKLLWRSDCRNCLLLLIPSPAQAAPLYFFLYHYVPQLYSMYSVRSDYKAMTWVPHEIRFFLVMRGMDR